MSQMSQIPRSFKLVAGSVTYLTLRGIYYYPFLESRDNSKSPILYTTYIFQTLIGIGMWPIATPYSIFTDIQFFEKRLRNIPLDRYDYPFPYMNCRIKEEYTKDANVVTKV